MSLRTRLDWLPTLHLATGQRVVELGKRGCYIFLASFIYRSSFNFRVTFASPLLRKLLKLVFSEPGYPLPGVSSYLMPRFSGIVRTASLFVRVRRFVYSSSLRGPGASLLRRQTVLPLRVDADVKEAEHAGQHGREQEVEHILLATWAHYPYVLRHHPAGDGPRFFHLYYRPSGRGEL